MDRILSSPWLIRLHTAQLDKHSEDSMVSNLDMEFSFIAFSQGVIWKTTPDIPRPCDDWFRFQHFQKKFFFLERRTYTILYGN